MKHDDVLSYDRVKPGGRDILSILRPITAALAIALITQPLVAQKLTGPLTDSRRLIHAGDLDAAAKRLQALEPSMRTEAPPPSDREIEALALTWLTLARAQQKTGDSESAGDAFLRCETWLRRAKGSIDRDRLTGLRMTIAEGQFACGRDGEARETLRVLHKSPRGVEPTQMGETMRRSALTVMKVARGQLRRGQFARSIDNFRWVIDSGPEDLAATADLGIAWAVLHDPQSSALQVTERLQRFLDRHPDHRDAALVRSRLPKHCIAAIRELDPEDADDSFDQLTDSLVKSSAGATDVTDLLGWLTENEQVDRAKTLAKRCIDQTRDGDDSVEVPTAAAAWLARRGDWSVIAEVASRLKPDTWLAPDRVRLGRIFAESLVQSGKESESADWFRRLVDQFGDEAFTSLLRLAENSVSNATLDQATTRVSAARQAAGDDPAKRAIVDLLRADLAVRGLRFGSARELLETVVRGGEVAVPLRGRAQWLIGETYYLQRKFELAIDAYRSVEAIDPRSDWAAPALVQAGKAFEQLGRTRAAAVCYGNLMERFPSSPHTDFARTRMASLPDATQIASPPSSDSTLRR